MATSARPTIVVVGASVAGGRAVEALRQEGFDGRIVLVGEEPVRPYERPPLSKEVLQGRRAPAEIHLRPEAWYAEHAVELRLGRRAVALDPVARVVALDGGERLGYDHLVIATGSEVRRLDLPGATLEGVHYLRTLADAERIRADLARGGRVAVIGFGFIGAEVAASCRQLGLEVTGIELLPYPLGRVAGELIGRFFAEEHRRQGVDLRLGTAVQGLRAGAAGRVGAVVTADGEAIPCEMVVVGVGVRPAVDWLAGSGLALENGVVVDDYCRTNLPGVYAAGDVANWWHPRLGRRLRVEHDDNAQQQGGAAARAILGMGEPYAPVPFFWSDQYDLTLQMVGICADPERSVVRGDPAERSFSVFLFAGGALQAVIGVNRPRDIFAGRRLLASGAPITPEQAADPNVDLRRLAAPR